MSYLGMTLLVVCQEGALKFIRGPKDFIFYFSKPVVPEAFVVLGLIFRARMASVKPLGIAGFLEPFSDKKKAGD